MSLFMHETHEDIAMRAAEDAVVDAKFKLIVEPYGEGSDSEESFTALFTQLFMH